MFQPWGCVERNRRIGGDKKRKEGEGGRKAVFQWVFYCNECQSSNSHRGQVIVCLSGLVQTTNVATDGLSYIAVKIKIEYDDNVRKRKGSRLRYRGPPNVYTKKL
jgi:hypothetical protein